jgi:hypothetical protein
MATRPSVFSVAPWGYRLLTPALVEAWPVRTVRAFRDVTALGLVLSGGLLFLWLRRLGNGEWACLLAVLAFSFSGPVAEAVRYRFLVEPVCFLLVVGFLLALAAGAPTAVLALVAALGVLSKEFFLLLPPLVFLERRRRTAWPRALLETALVALPAVGLTLWLRLGWTPYLQAPLPSPEASMLAAAWQRFLVSLPDWRSALLLGGLTPLAMVGACLAKGRPLRATSAYLFLATLLPPFVNPVAFFAQDIPRLLLYALPAALPLALVAVDRVVPHLAGPRPPGRWPPWLSLAAAGGLLAVLLVTWRGLDPYRRVDLQGPRDGPLALALCRESLRAASRLERGEAVRYDMADQFFVWGETPLHRFDRVRWFLGAGWGVRPQYGVGDAVMRAPQAELLLPVFTPRDLDVTLELLAPSVGPLTAFVAGQAVGEALPGPEPGRFALRVPARALVRGDNRLTLLAAPGTRLRSVELESLGGAGPGAAR